jgi:hypothetical protein
LGFYSLSEAACLAKACQAGLFRDTILAVDTRQGRHARILVFSKRIKVKRIVKSRSLPEAHDEDV